MIIHSSSIIEPGAKIGAGVKIGPFCSVGKDVTLADQVELVSHISISGITQIGEKTKIYPFASIGHAPQDLKYNGEASKTIIGASNTIREYVTIQPGTAGDSMQTVVGDHCLLMVGSHVAHDCVVGNNCILSNSVQIAGHVTLGDYAWIAGVSAVHQFVNIGQHSYIAGGSLVSKDVPPYIKAVRNPLSYGGVNSVGLKRRGFDLEKINHILDIYRYIFNKGMNTTQALEFIEEELPATDERDEIVTFIRDSGRGIIKRFGKGAVDED